MSLINKIFKNRGETGAIPLNASVLNEIVSAINSLENNTNNQTSYSIATLNNSIQTKSGETSNLKFEHIFTNNSAKFKLVNGEIKYTGDRLLFTIFKGYCSNVANGWCDAYLNGSSSSRMRFGPNSLTDMAADITSEKTINVSLSFESSSGTATFYPYGTRLIIFEI